VAATWRHLGDGGAAVVWACWRSAYLGANLAGLAACRIGSRRPSGHRMQCLKLCVQRPRAAWHRRKTLDVYGFCFALLASERRHAAFRCTPHAIDRAHSPLYSCGHASNVYAAIRRQRHGMANKWNGGASGGRSFKITDGVWQKQHGGRRKRRRHIFSAVKYRVCSASQHGVNGVSLPLRYKRVWCALKTASSYLRINMRLSARGKATAYQQRQRRQQTRFAWAAA